jgi:RNA polymerase sigma-70 factor (ECF subfamily)
MHSLDEIYEMYSKKVYLFFVSKTNNEELAEELTQETFFQAVQGIDRFEGRSSVLTWLCGIAKNVWLNYLKKHQEIFSIEENVEIEDKRDVNVQWEQKEILKFIHGMNDPMREVMYLRLISNLSFAEIGEIIGKSENWTRVTFFRGKQKIIKEILNDE